MSLKIIEGIILSNIKTKKEALEIVAIGCERRI
jgi:hypothetical protein